MKTEKDYEEFLELLNKHSVRYCIIGSHALAFHARPRYTKDIDILVEASLDNAERILTALDEFGFGSLNLSIEDFSSKGNIIQLGYEPVRIDIITSIEGLDFADIWKNRVQSPYGNQTVNFLHSSPYKFFQTHRVPNPDHIEVFFLHGSRIRHFWKCLTPVFSF